MKVLICQVTVRIKQLNKCKVFRIECQVESDPLY